ncbi:MAG: nuclear transport factor 2 family protein [Ignavibacteria bacterium]|nr:nuclear transport factor 2 family protein [Ignavibacteria bacterium]
MKKSSTLIIFLSVLIYSFSFGQSSLTDLLTKQFHQAWNKENINEMVSQLQHDAFFKSPHQLRYGRDKMAATVLKTNPSKYKVVSTKEIHSKVEDDIAWSIGEFTSDIYDKYGNKTKEQLKGTYTYVFTKKNKGDWKVQMLIYHEQE